MIFSVDENEDKARMFAGDTGQFIGAMAGGTAATWAVTSVAEYTAASIAGVALVSKVGLFLVYVQLQVLMLGCTVEVV